MTSGIGDRISYLRRQKNMTQQDLADRLGISRSAVSTYERSSAIPPVDAICDLCTILDTTSDYLLGLDHRRMMSLDGLTEWNIRILSELKIRFLTLIQKQGNLKK